MRPSAALAAVAVLCLALAGCSTGSGDDAAIAEPVVSFPTSAAAAAPAQEPKEAAQAPGTNWVSITPAGKPSLARSASTRRTSGAPPKRCAMTWTSAPPSQPRAKRPPTSPSAHCPP
ncbi:hypothetical protein [Corynebacterium auris]|uniref:hypothetical protein n=1 Tax=Corynebacterium auris TaxID=44750 RepID=UPI0025B40791|nr:hypothetical protein [Corynebacterium auris]WJY68616.1 hypothetical protein CAURIS_08625 [Corynebacterium auris]